ncbi:MAG: hypothetical protein K6B28_11100 [Lachnospiraceae bacterium]|nr:hypothetical protein [Lachnospiraceae bacterium]
MFTVNELNELIDLNDFDVLDKSANSIILQSKITSHCWKLLNRDYNDSSSVIIYHTLYYGMDFLEQCCARNLEQALQFVKNLDACRGHYSKTL